MWTDECNQLLRCVVVAQGFAQNHGSLSIAVIGSQCHKSLVCKGKTHSGLRLCPWSLEPVLTPYPQIVMLCHGPWHLTET